MLTFFVLNVLMTDDFPTFGYPTNPTEIACLSLFKRANCLKTESKEPCYQIRRENIRICCKQNHKVMMPKRQSLNNMENKQ